MDRDLIAALDYALNRGFQIHPDALESMESMEPSVARNAIRGLVRAKARRGPFMISRDDLESFLGLVAPPGTDLGNDHDVLSDPTPHITSAEGAAGYNALFASRYEKMKKLVAGRPEAKLLKTAAAAKQVKRDEEAYVCGLVSSKSVERSATKVVLDDPTGTVELVAFEGGAKGEADGLFNDQFVMAKAVPGRNGGLVAKEIMFPGVSDHRSGRSETEAHAIFLSDLHVGSRYFMEAEFDELAEWLRGPDPVAKAIRFMVIGGDLVDGVGIYPNQDKELVCQTLEEQLEKADRLLGRVPDRIKIFVIPGNHDPGRRALPQPAIPKKHCPGLRSRENVFMLGNPSTISLNGVRVAMFHGQSIDDLVKTTPGLSYSKPVDAMRRLLEARHYSPIFGSQTPIAPESEDMLVMDEAPDILHMGHVHITGLGMYRGVMMINAGTWQSRTPFQVSVGQEPTPCQAIIVNLKTFRVFYKDFAEGRDVVGSGGAAPPAAGP